MCSRQTDVPATVSTESGTESRFSFHDDTLTGRPSNVSAASLAGNPDIRVPETVKIEDGLRAARGEKEKDADRAGRTPRGGSEETEGTPRTREALNTSTQDRIATKEETEERELCHVPGGTWLNQSPKKSIFAGQEETWGKEKRQLSTKNPQTI
ncbi:hypothetical protein NDU88_001023 [Pleurodeles waltl]|uniref:Uncharacterized protein n=1 Tax=Pleurodeles waltl TaxID=8319 RepID=A0AAV7NC96_PLEWA|nr:hypothetical protein NDU88_001023 [Pleurodeles waltl]